MESVQYSGCLATAGAIRGTSKEKLYQEPGLESIKLRRWYRKLCLFHNVFESKHPEYIFYLTLVRCTPYTTRTVHDLPVLKKTCFIPSNISEWNISDNSLRNSENFLTLKKKFFSF